MEYSDSHGVEVELGLRGWGFSGFIGWAHPNQQKARLGKHMEATRVEVLLDRSTAGSLSERSVINLVYTIVTAGWSGTLTLESSEKKLVLGVLDGEIGTATVAANFETARDEFVQGCLWTKGTYALDADIIPPAAGLRGFGSPFELLIEAVLSRMEVPEATARLRANLLVYPARTQLADWRLRALGNPQPLSDLVRLCDGATRMSTVLRHPWSNVGDKLRCLLYALETHIIWPRSSPELGEVQLVYANRRGHPKGEPPAEERRRAKPEDQYLLADIPPEDGLLEQELTADTPTVDDLLEQELTDDGIASRPAPEPVQIESTTLEATPEKPSTSQRSSFRAPQTAPEEEASLAQSGVGHASENPPRLDLSVGTPSARDVEPQAVPVAPPAQTPAPVTELPPAAPPVSFQVEDSSPVAAVPDLGHGLARSGEAVSSASSRRTRSLSSGTIRRKRSTPSQAELRERRRLQAAEAAIRASVQGSQPSSHLRSPNSNPSEPVVNEYKPHTGVPARRATPVNRDTPLGQVPEDEVAVDVVGAQRSSKRGYKFIAEGNYSGALSEFSRATSLDPENPSYRGFVLWASYKNVPNKAEFIINRLNELSEGIVGTAFEAQRHRAKIQLVLGRISRDEGDDEQARVHFAAAVELDPNNADAQQEAEASRGGPKRRPSLLDRLRGRK